MTWHVPLEQSGWILVILLLITLPCAASAAPGPDTLTIIVKDERTRGNIDQARVYLDGGYRGETSGGENAGVLAIQDVVAGMHTLRITRSGYTEKITRFSYPDTSVIEVSLAKESLVFLGEGAPSQNAINVVFYPSSTSYNCSERTIVPTPVYLTNETRFREDVWNVIRFTYLELANATSAIDPLPDNYRERFNFYYYYDPSAPADAFSGCAGTIPAKYWNEVTFADVTVILYPSYYGIYSDASCQPTGCTQDTGTAHTVMKVPADQPVLLKHETGHALYGLIDTYCGNTYYYQNDPYPNVWESADSCMADARSDNRDPGRCRQIQKSNARASASCVRNYWQWDPSPDIMANGYSGKFGAAATQRINYVLSKVEA